MKTIKFQAILLRTLCIIIAVFALHSCGETSSDASRYALGESCYFTPKKGEQAIFSNNSVPQSIKTLGYDEMNRRIEIRGFDMDIDGHKFCLISKSFTPANSLVTKDSYKLHALIKQADKENPYFEEGEYYSDSYYFVDPEELNKAVQIFNSVPKAKSEASKLNASDHEGGAITCKSKIIAVVSYAGCENGRTREFASIYLECGEVVRSEGDKIDVKDTGETIDCVLDKNNDIVEYEFI